MSDLQNLIATAVKEFGRVDIMVNNAGVETRTSILDTTEAQYEKVMNINLKSAFFGTQLAAQQMIKQGGGGRIINISSVHEDWPMPGNTAYCLSKGGMRMLTRTAGVELAPHNILVVGVGPGAVATPINLSTMQNPELLRKLEQRHSTWPYGPSRRKLAESLHSSLVMVPAISRRRLFLLTAESCKAVPASRLEFTI